MLPLNYLLATVWRQIEHKDRQEGDAHARDDQVDSVEQRLSTHSDVERDVQVWLVAAGVVLDVAHGRNLEDVPLDGHVELGEVDADFNLRPPVLFVNVTQVHLK